MNNIDATISLEWFSDKEARFKLMIGLAEFEINVSSNTISQKSSLKDVYRIFNVENDEGLLNIFGIKTDVLFNEIEKKYRVLNEEIMGMLNG